jgi:hypothetical protein
MKSETEELDIGKQQSSLKNNIPTEEKIGILKIKFR